MGAFNSWVRNSFLEAPERREVVQVALNLLEGAAQITRAQQARTCGVPVPTNAFHYKPRPLAVDQSYELSGQSTTKVVIEHVKRPPIAVVGVSALFPGSVDAEHFWRNIAEGVDLLSEVPESHWRISDDYDPGLDTPDKMYATRGRLPALCRLRAHRLRNHLRTRSPIPTPTQAAHLRSPSKAGGLPPEGDFSQMDIRSGPRRRRRGSATETAAHMSERSAGSGVGERALRGAGIAGDQLEAFKERIAAAYTPWQESTFPGLLGNVVAGRIANRFDLGGTNCVVDAACASSLAAVDMALNDLSSAIGLVITGGVDALNDILMFMCFGKTPALSPTGDCRPFSDNADGTMLGEAGHAGAQAPRGRRARRRPHLRGHPRHRHLSDGRAKSIYAPSRRGRPGAGRAYRRRVTAPRPSSSSRRTAQEPEPATLPSLRHLRVFDARPGARAQLVRARLGQIAGGPHQSRAAAWRHSFKAVMALHHKVLPPTIKIDRPNPPWKIDKSPFYLSTDARPWIATRACPGGIGQPSSVPAAQFPCDQVEE